MSVIYKSHDIAVGLALLAVSKHMYTHRTDALICPLPHVLQYWLLVCVYVTVPKVIDNRGLLSVLKLMCGVIYQGPSWGWQSDGYNHAYSCVYVCVPLCS